MLTQQIVPPTGQQLTARAETVQSEMKPWSDLTRPSKIRRLDAAKNTNGVSAVNTPLPQAASRMSNSTAVQTGKLTQQVCFLCLFCFLLRFPSVGFVCLWFDFCLDASVFDPI